MKELYLETKCVFEEHSGPDLGLKNKCKPELILYPYTFAVSEVIAYRKMIEDDGSSPYSVVYFRSGQNMTINLEYDKFASVFKEFHNQREK